MKNSVGLWIDHKKAVIVTAESEGGSVEQIDSHVDGHTRFLGREKPAKGPLGEDHEDRKYLEHLNKFYDEVIAHLRGAEAVFIMGPGEAKREIEKRLTQSRKKIVGVESADKMTNPQIAAKIRHVFAS